MEYLKYDNLEKQYFELLLKFCLKVDKSLFTKALEMDIKHTVIFIQQSV